MSSFDRNNEEIKREKGREEGKGKNIGKRN
jgi:hypothetical protein